MSEVPHVLENTHHFAYVVTIQNKSFRIILRMWIEERHRDHRDGDRKEASIMGR
jgi:hypothetical protein